MLLPTFPRGGHRLVATCLGLVLAACGLSDAGDGVAAERPGRDAEVTIATTVAPITSIAANIGGDRVQITGIVPEGTDSHTFEPAPSVAELLGTVDVVYLNGLSLEEPTRALAEANLREGAAIVELGTQAISEEDHLFDRSFPEEGGRPNPHLWTEPAYALEYARIIAEDLTLRDPGGEEHYRTNFGAFKEIVTSLDEAMREDFDTIPAADKKLLTYHDAYAYFARSYDWEVIGAIQVADFEEPTPREVAELIDQVRETGVPAIFGSEVFPSPVLDQIAQETGVAYVEELRDDDLPGEPGDDEHSWLGLMVFNYATMTEALGGDASALSALEVRNVVPDLAEYPQ